MAAVVRWGTRKSGTALTGVWKPVAIIAGVNSLKNRPKPGFSLKILKILSRFYKMGI